MFPIVATTTTIQKFQGPPVSGSIWLGSDTRKPANGRISSEGSGIIADSIAMATQDAEVADGAVQAVQERDDDLVDEREQADLTLTGWADAGSIADYPRHGE